MTELKRTSLGAVPVFYAEAPPPFVGSLMFRVGRADEQAATCGLTRSSCSRPAVEKVRFTEMKRRDADRFAAAVRERLQVG